ncbi:bifunctional metallophosphatase/5'-nucleotidase [Kineosporia rhizophila]|uniref:bifunctional metallophosphatase/5'-nucleotidase n=1 Tax=Kineosporia rhizophila TaxID=84633 RepID=UPI001E290A10|nr:bifunctional metallophosphatase/5'-nucleotidase [Kineosporia rhizophila]MCE0534353.1 bifunctional metallophosphatase/5'-nucleotidase [Kineosporia rhizophila]
MKSLTKRTGGITAAIAAGTVAALFALPATPAQAADAADKVTPVAEKKKPKTVDLQILGFNDFHGHLQSDSPGTVLTKKGEVEAGGAEYLSTKLATLRKGEKNSLTLATGDQIGGSPFLSGLFKDEPSIDALNRMKVDAAVVGNHEFDEGIPELLRMQYGGNHPTEGAFDKDGYSGANFKMLAGNVKYKKNAKVTKPKNAKKYGSWFSSSTGKTVLPPTTVKVVNGVKVGIIGVVTSDTPQLVAQAGIKDVTFTDEVKAANLAAKDLRKRGVKSIIALVHEGGLAPEGATFDYKCNNGSGANLTGPIVDIAKKLSPSIDVILSGHTHNSYVCDIKDPAGNSRLVTSDLSYGKTVTEINLKLSKKTGDVIRSSVKAKNVVVDQKQKKAADQTKIIAKWQKLAGPIANTVVGDITADIKRSESRDSESSLGDLIADAQLASTKAAADGGAQMAFMNPGGVRADLTFAGSAAGEGNGKVTYGESFTVQPFGNLLVSLDLTGKQIDTLLEQQWSKQTDGTTKFLHLGVSEGFSYSWSRSAAIGSKVDASTIKLNGETIVPGTTYRVTVNSFLADGGDGFAVLPEGKNRAGGGEDLEAFNAYLKANSPVTGPTPNRVTALD